MTTSWQYWTKDLAKRLSEVLNADISPTDVVVPPDRKLGDFAFGCFKLAKALGKSPADIAKEVAESINLDQSDFASANAAGPYVNFLLREGDAVHRVVREIELNGNDYGSTDAGKKQQLLLEYASLNSHKEIHVGHFRNLVLGASLDRILGHAGWKVVPMSYYGDVGTHVAKCLWTLVRTLGLDPATFGPKELDRLLSEAKPEQRTGRYGEDLILVVPIGTIAHIKNPKKDYEVVYPEEMVRIAIGGRGGRGNLAFKSSTNRSPQRSEPGKPGEEHDVTMELRLIADIGFVGLPNTGKSSMLNELTAAGAKVANYPFTTLEPNLGVVDDIILADIPGLIEGASRGKGLGIKFLRHIQRTRHLVHFISADSKSPVTDYRVVRKELKKHDEKLVRKPDYIFISKSDLLPPKKIKELIKKVKKINPHVMAVSIHDWDGVQDVRKLFHKIVKKKSK